VVRLVDLDDSSGLERAWEELEKRRQIRALDPEYRTDIERAVRRALAAKRIDEAQAEAIRQELDEAHPAIVMRAHWRVLIPNRPALGAFLPQPPSRFVAGPDTWLQEDPSRLARVVVEIRRSLNDERRVAEIVLQLAERLEIPEDIAVRSIAVGVVAARAQAGDRLAR
jgi:hypothetical protein